MWDYLIVLSVLSPIELPVTTEASPQAWQALKTIALHLEVVGPHENWASDFRSELRYVRFYTQELVEAPPLSDCDLLPPSDMAADCCRFNEQFQCHLQNQQLLCVHRAAEFGTALRETRQLYNVWDAVRRANSTSQAWAYRRRTLKQLQDLLGEEAYHCGQLPPSVPTWRFQEID